MVCEVGIDDTVIMCGKLGEMATLASTAEESPNLANPRLIRIIEARYTHCTKVEVASHS